ncbi:macro domain-like protein, partial [Atractiella rhizophila]
KTLGGCETGDAKIAPGFNLPAQFVIHTAGPIYNEYEDPQEAEEDLEDCYTACLERAIEINENAGKTEEGVESIAFCGISTGIYGFPLGKATHIALRTVRSFLENHPKQELVKNIVFVCFPLRDYEVYKTLIPVYFPPTHPGRKDDEQFIPEEEAFVPKEIAFPKPEDVFLPNSVLRMSRQIESGEKKKWDDFDI